MNMIENNMKPILKPRKIYGLPSDSDIPTEQEQKTLALRNEINGLRHLLKEIDIDVDKLLVFVEANARPSNFARNPAFFTISHEIKDQCATRRIDMPDSMTKELMKHDDFTRRSIERRVYTENWTDLDYVKYTANKKLLKRMWSNWCIQFA